MHQTRPHPPKMDVLSNIFPHIFQARSPTSSDNLCLSFCEILILWPERSLPWLVHQTSHVVTLMIVTLYNRCNTTLMFTLLYKCPINIFYNVTLVLLIVNDFNYFYIYLFVWFLSIFSLLQVGQGKFSWLAIKTRQHHNRLTQKNGGWSIIAQSFCSTVQ